MPTLTIKNIPDPVHNALSLLAAQDGLSIEDEVRHISTTVCLNDRQPPSSLQNVIKRLYQSKAHDPQIEQLLRERRLEAENE
jgi:plasmid stability protein